MDVLRLLSGLVVWGACVWPGYAAEARKATEEWTGRRIGELAAQLKDDDYLRRADASRKLSAAPIDVLPTIECLAQEAEDPEARQRLFAAARAIFQRQIAQRLPEWKKGRGYFGLAWSCLAWGTGRPNEAGALIESVVPNSPADLAGLRRGDVVLSINGDRFEAGIERENAARIWRQTLAGENVTLLVKKAEAATEAEKEGAVKVVVVVGEWPDGKPRDNEPSEEEKRDLLWVRYWKGSPESRQESQGAAALRLKRNSLQSWCEGAAKSSDE